MIEAYSRKVVCIMQHGHIPRDAEGKFFPARKEDLVELVRDDDVHLGSINTSRITDMSYLFSIYNRIEKKKAKKRNPSERKDYSGIETWNVSNVEDMTGMFMGATNFNQPLNAWDTSHVTGMKKMFYETISFNKPLDHWDVSNVEDMSCMFCDAHNFNQPLDSWDVSSVRSMCSMFYDAMSFNQSLNSWDVSRVQDMSGMFFGARAFNQPIKSWDVSQVETMSLMFADATSFNQPLNLWDVSRVKTMHCMFDRTASLDRRNLKKIAESWKRKNKDCSKYLMETLKEKYMIIERSISPAYRGGSLQKL